MQFAPNGEVKIPGGGHGKSIHSGEEFPCAGIINMLNLRHIFHFPKGFVKR